MMGLPALPRADPFADAEANRATESALRAAILGDAGTVRSVAEHRRAEEQAERRAGLNPARISDNIATLSKVSESLIPPLGQVKKTGMGTDPDIRQLHRLLRSAEPGQRFREARADRRFEKFRRIYNGILGPVYSVFTLQFFDLLVLPFEGLEQLLIGSEYVTPEERRELRTARDIVQPPRSDLRTREVAAAAVRKFSPRRDQLAGLHARQNGSVAWEDGRLDVADWWYRREMLLLQRSQPFRSAHERVIRDIAAQYRDRQASISVLRGEDLLNDPREFASYAALLRAFVANPQSEETAQRALDFRVDHPYSLAVPTVLSLGAGKAMKSGDREVARYVLRQVAADAKGQSPWARRAKRMLDRGEISPEIPFERAMGAARGRWFAYISTGTDPRVFEDSLTAEDARLTEGGWIQSARALFVFDRLSRLLLSPFLPAGPVPELFHAAGAAPEDWKRTPEGRDWMRRVADAMATRKRHEEARSIYGTLGMSERVYAMDQRTARELEKQALQEEDASRRLAMLERITRAYPEYRQIARVDRERRRARAEAAGVLRVPRDVLRAYPELWDADFGGLPILPELLDGSRKNGELDAEGVMLLGGGGMVYADQRSGEVVEVPLSMEETMRAADLAAARMRSVFAAREAAKPLPRRRIPLAIEGSAGPGLDIAPGLVPLTPDPSLRRLYE